MARKNQEHEEVEIYIPEDELDKRPVFVGHQGREWSLKRGEHHTVPAIVAEILSQSDVIKAEE